MNQGGFLLIKMRNVHCTSIYRLIPLKSLYRPHSTVGFCMLCLNIQMGKLVSSKVENTFCRFRLLTQLFYFESSSQAIIFCKYLGIICKFVVYKWPKLLKMIYIVNSQYILTNLYYRIKDPTYEDKKLKSSHISLRIIKILNFTFLICLKKSDNVTFKNFCLNFLYPCLPCQLFTHPSIPNLC